MIKVNYIGTKVFEKGQHVVVDYNNSGSYLYNNKRQIFIPAGYRLVSGSGEYTCFFENIVPVRAKVYEKNGQKFSPEFGQPLKPY